MFCVKKSINIENEFEKVSIKNNEYVNSQFNGSRDNSWDWQRKFSSLFQIDNNNKG